MLSIGTQRLFQYSGAVDLRRGFDGLSALVEEAFPGELLSGALFIFVNRRRNRMKVLFWDSDGLALYYKRLEQGTFRVSWTGHVELTRREFTMLMEGVVPRRLYRRFELPKKS